MYPTKTKLLIAILVMGVTAIASEEFAPLWVYGVFKITTTLLVLLLASSNKQISRLGARVFVALFFCLFGDIALLWEDGFLVGLGFFLVAHLLFIRAFKARFRITIHWMALLTVFGIAGTCLYFILPNVDQLLQIAILGYVSILGIMSTLSMSIGLSRKTKYSLQLAIGGLLFMVSDALLGINAFVNPIPFASILILTTYWGAITSLANAAREF